MRRLATLCLFAATGLTLAGCSDTWWNPPLTGGYEPHRPVTDSDNMRRVTGGASASAALTTEPGDIWPGPLPPSPTIRDLEQQYSSGAATQPLPPPNATPSVGVPVVGSPTAVRRQPPDASRGPITVPNGNGTSSVIYPDGRIETVPTPK